MQHPRPVGPTTNTAAAASAEMFQGAAPDRSPARHDWRQISRRAGLQVSQTTPVAFFQNSMVSDARPQQPRIAPLRKLESTIKAPDLAVFSAEMTLGARPASPRLFLAPKIPLPLSQPTHVAAPLGLEMTQGDLPRRYRQSLAARGTWMGLAPDVVAAIVEMVQGSRPDRPRLFLAPRLPLPWAQPTPVEITMVDSTRGARPESPRLPRLFHQGWLTPAPDVARFGQEMVIGSTPSRPRLFLAPRLPLPLAQTTPVGVFSLEMVYGARPERNRERLSRAVRVGQSIWIMDIPVVVITQPAGCMISGSFSMTIALTGSA